MLCLIYFLQNFDYIFICIKCFLLELLESNNNNFEAGDAEQNNESDIFADNITTAPIVIEQVDDDDNFSNFVIEFRRTMTDIQLQLQTLENKQEQIQETINIILTKINNEQYHKKGIETKKLGQ
ncbi:uncharacterized protein LOC120358553 [Solenopsis invicta]|uniref:uncharacterized protein LOC120358553 n=1 Tax=Solenopsis invicta TaxID=13686 RepID=UPI00193DE86E|nr:uncharacterized protein LOC120358553 [Solenopsis invicta]